MPSRDPLEGRASADLALRFYYLATPLFAALDLGAGVNVRLAGLEGYPSVRIAYYLLCLGCAAAVWRLPRVAAPLGLLEGSATILLLILGVMLVLIDMPARLEDGNLATAKASLLQAVANLIISGPFWLVSLYRNPLLSGPRSSRSPTW